MQYIIHFILGCRKGYFGASCTLPCKYPLYGNNCEHKCNCTLSNCNHIKGCLDTSGIPNKLNISFCIKMNPGNINWFPIYLTSTGSEDKVAEKFEKAAIIGSCSLFILITIVLIIMIRKYRSNKKQVKKYHYKPTLTSSFTAQTNYNRMFRQGGITPEIYENTNNTTVLEGKEY